ncbi:MAG: zinc metallopeptidase [Flavobacteriales bacterium]
MIYIILLAFAGIGFLVSRQLKKKFKTYSQVPLSSSFSGKEIAEKMLKDHGIHDVRVVSTPGELTDHYNPNSKTVNLSEGVYHGRHIAAAAVSAHECGHAVQHARAYAWLQMRSKLVPIVNLSSKIMNVIFIFGIIGSFAFSFGYDVIILTVIIAQAVIAAFALITLPVEYDASNRAMIWLETSGVAGRSELEKANDALLWAARTYLVSALAALTTLAYYVLMYTRRD